MKMTVKETIVIVAGCLGMVFGAFGLIAFLRLRNRFVVLL